MSTLAYKVSTPFGGDMSSEPRQLQGRGDRMLQRREFAHGAGMTSLPKLKSGSADQDTSDAGDGGGGDGGGG